METTIIRLEPNNSPSEVTVRMASFEEAFGDYSEARGRGRARRTARRMERIANRRAVRTERRKLKSDRQQERIQRRATRKASRQEMRNQQQEARQNRRQYRQDARNQRKMTAEQGDQERENYGLEQENYRESIAPQDSEQDFQQGGGYADEQGGGYADEQGGGYADEQGGGYADEQGYTDSEDWNTPPEGYDDQNSGDGGYGDDNSQETPYNQEQSEFGDDSYFNVEGMDGKNNVSERVKDLVARLQKNQSALKNLKERRNAMSRRGDNTTGIVMRIKEANDRVFNIKNQLENYAVNGKTQEERNRRREEIKLALGGVSKEREIGQYGGSEVPVEKELNASIEPNKITVPAQSSFDDMSYFDDEMSYFDDDMSSFDEESYLNADSVTTPTISAKVTDLVSRLRNNQNALKDLKQQRDLFARQGKPTGMYNSRMKEANDRIFNLKKLLEQYIISAPTQQERKLRREEVQTAKGGTNTEAVVSSFDDVSYFEDGFYSNADAIGTPTISAKVTDLVSRLRNNQKALKDLKQQRDLFARQGKPTGMYNSRMKEANDRIFNLKKLLEQYIISAPTQQERTLRRQEVQTAKGGTNVEAETSSFDAYSDLGRPIIINGVAQNDTSYKSNDLLTDNGEPTTIDLFSNADGKASTNTKSLVSVAIGIGVGALAIYLAKKKGWI
jgi:hypothetical protein